MKNMKNLFLEENENEKIVEEEEMKVKTGWSLKKKVLIAGGALAGLVVGAVALGVKKSKDDIDDEYEFDEDPMEDLESDEFDDNEESEESKDE